GGKGTVPTPDDVVQKLYDQFDGDHARSSVDRRARSATVGGGAPADRARGPPRGLQRSGAGTFGGAAVPRPERPAAVGAGGRGRLHEASHELSARSTRTTRLSLPERRSRRPAVEARAAHRARRSAS